MKTVAMPEEERELLVVTPDVTREVIRAPMIIMQVDPAMAP